MTLPAYPEAIADIFKERFGEKPALIVRAPGRINLIGEHTDYNDGFVLPAAIDKAIYFAVSPRTDQRVVLYAKDLNDEFSGDLDHLQRAPSGWPNYLMGVMSEAMRDGHQIKGVNVAIGGDIPSGAGVSSSAAVESGMIFALNHLFGLGLSSMDMVKIAQRGENRFVGVNCGIMDMFASVMGRAESVVRLDCRNLEYAYYPFHTPEHTLILCNSGVKHSLVDSEYNTRRSECEEGVRLLREIHGDINSLRDASPEILHEERLRLPEKVFNRCLYVTEEIRRVKAACHALEYDDLDTFGQLMYQTHDGLQHLYEVSCPELDFLVDATRQDEFVLGARIMGGGFGGCSINIVQRDAVSAFTAKMGHAYKTKFGIDLACYEVAPSAGVHMINL